jgi:hypothetical protein
MGNHYNGAYDPIWDINDELEVLNAQKSWQVVSINNLQSFFLCHWRTKQFCAALVTGHSC